MISTSDFKNGINIEVEGAIFTIIWFQHHKPGKGGAMMRTKLKNIRTGSTIERTFKSGEKFRDVELERKKKQYLYSSGDTCHFMDLETYEEVALPKENIGESVKFLKEDMELFGLYMEGEFLGLELPLNVNLKVTHTMTGVRGDTVSNAMKPATLETGIEIQVPLFISEGDIVKVDTRTSEYIERA